MAFRRVGMGQMVDDDPQGASAELSAEMAKRKANMGEVAAFYGVHRETFARWCDKLAAAGFPVAGRGEATRGRKPPIRAAEPARSGGGRVRRAAAQ
jgi:hypothetical protein